MKQNNRFYRNNTKKNDSNNKLVHTPLIRWAILLVALVPLAGALVLPAFSQEEATTSADDEVIRDNVKKRIESVVKGQQTNANQAIAYIGLLESIANNTLTVNTTEGIRLASTSATTATVELDSGDELDIEEVGIGEYVSVLGFITETDVLDARRIIVSDEPEEPTFRSIFGSITTLDIDEEIIIIQTISETMNFLYDSDTNLFANENGEKVVIDFEDLAQGSQVLVVFTEAEDEEEPHTLLELLVDGSQLNLTTNEATESAEEE